MRHFGFTTVALVLTTSSATAQDLNKLVYGPLEGDSAGVLTVHNGEEIEIEMWVRTDPGNPGGLVGVAHALMSEDAIIASRNGAEVYPPYDSYPWILVYVDGPFTYDPDDPCPIPEGHTVEIQCAIYDIFAPPPYEPIRTFGEWVNYGAFLMTCSTGVPTDETYYPFSAGWYPHSGQGTNWAFQVGGVAPEQDFCGLYFGPDTCIYIPGDVNHNGASLELADVVAMIGNYRGTVEPYYFCTCTEESPYLGFAAAADPNGNCIPNELSDLVIEIGAYRGTSEVSGCPDCPGSE